MIKDFNNKLDLVFPNPKCELNYNKDYELLIATMLSAQCTDKRVNEVTSILFNKYDIYSLSKANKADIEMIIRPLGSFSKKSEYMLEIAKKLVNDYDGIVPNNREYLETLPGVGRKTTNVVLSNLFEDNVFSAFLALSISEVKFDVNSDSAAVALVVSSDKSE